MEKKLRVGDPLIADGQYHLYRIEDDHAASGHVHIYIWWSWYR